MHDDRYNSSERWLGAGRTLQLLLVGAALASSVLAVQLASAQDTQRPAGQARRVALVGGQLLDGYEARPIHHAAILIEGNRIVAVGPASEVEIPPGTEVINTAGRTMLPGLIDAHAHLIILGHGNYPDWMPWFEKNEQLVYETSAKQLLAAGVTTAVDLGAPMSILAFRDRVNRNDLPGPRLLVSGPWIARSTWNYLPPELQATVRTPQEAAQKAKALVDAGVDVIKAWQGITEEDYVAMRAVTRPAGVRIHCHVYQTEDVWAAIRGGCNVLQHAGSGGTVPKYPDDLVAEIAMRGIPVVQTISHRIWIYEASLDFPERLYNPELVASFPPEIWEQVKSSYTPHDFHRRSYFRRTPRETRLATEAARQFIQAGAVMAMGTDTGSPLNFHTESAWREISALVESGMTPIEAISASTKVAAEVIGRGNDLGTIEPGKLADIIVVDGNPLFDINVLGYVTDVVKDGIVYKRNRVPVWQTQTM